MKRMMTLICALALFAALLTGCAARLPEEDAAQPPQNAERTAEEVVQPTVEEVDEPAEETRSAQELLDVYLGRDNAPAQAAEELLAQPEQAAAL